MRPRIILYVVWLCLLSACGALLPDATLKRAMDTNNCINLDCAAEDAACASSGQCVSAHPPMLIAA